MPGVDMLRGLNQTALTRVPPSQWLRNRLRQFASLLLGKLSQPPRRRDHQLTINRQPRELTTALIAELIATDQAFIAQQQPSIGSEIRAVIDVLSFGGSVLDLLDQRIVQARDLWDAGWGAVTGTPTFADYLATIPEVPSLLRPPNPDFPFLVLVDARVSLFTACHLMGVTPTGNQHTIQMKALHTKGQVYWMRCHDGARYADKTIGQAEHAFSAIETGLSAQEGIAFFVQNPTLLKTTYLDLPGTPHEGYEQSSACLGIWKGRAELRWRWKHELHELCRVVSRHA